MERNFTSDIDMASLIRDLLRNWLTIVLSTAAAILFTYVWVNINYTPTYTSRAVVAVTRRATTSTIYTNLSAATEVATRFGKVLESNVMKKTVLEDLGLETFDATATAVQVPETNMLTISVTSGSAYESYFIVKSILENYDVVSDYLVGKYILETIQEPSVPMTPSNSANAKGAMRRSGLIAAALVMLAIAWLSYRRDTVKNVYQLKHKVDAKPLGIIYHERKNDRRYKTTVGAALGRAVEFFHFNAKDSGISMLITNPMRSFFYVESNKMMASRIRSRMDRRGAKVLLVTSVMENEGKSTVAANIALGIAGEGKKVLLIDADFRKPSQFKIFQLSKDERINLVKEMDEGITNRAPVQYEDTSLYLLANYKRTGNVSGEFDGKTLKKLVKCYHSEMDYIILDTSPMALVVDTEDMAIAAGTSVIVIREDVVLAQHINDAIDTLNRQGSQVIGCVYNNVTRRRFAANQGTYTHGYGGYYGTYKK